MIFGQDHCKNYHHIFLCAFAFCAFMTFDPPSKWSQYRRDSLPKQEHRFAGSMSAVWRDPMYVRPGT